MPTNLEKYHIYLKDFPTPPNFIDWNYFYLISSCLGRRVWLGELSYKPIFANQFIIFVGKAATGKSLPAIETAKMLESLKTVEMSKDQEPVERQLVKFSPDSTTLEALYDSIDEAKEQLFIKEEGKPPILLWHSSISFVIGEELATLFTESCIKDLVPFLTQGWSCGSFYRKTRHNGQVRIPNMCINFLGCCTQKWLGEMLKSHIMHQGFTSRCIVLYSPVPLIPVTLQETPEKKQAFKDIQEHLRKIVKLKGQVVVKPETTEWFDKWVKENFLKHKNPDEKLEDYYSRKPLHIRKVALAHHFGEVDFDPKKDLDDKGNFIGDPKVMTLSKEDLEYGIVKCEEAEIDMHRALSRESKENPIFNLATRIEEGLKLSPSRSLSRSKILLDYFDGGNDEDITKALQFLQTVGKVTPFAGDRGMTNYKLLEHQSKG